LELCLCLYGLGPYPLEFKLCLLGFSPKSLKFGLLLLDSRLLYLLDRWRHLLDRLYLLNWLCRLHLLNRLCRLLLQLLH
jgi:hypothetical protein